MRLFRKALMMKKQCFQILFWKILFFIDIFFYYLCLTRENMVFGAGKGEGGYNKAKNGAKNAGGAKRSSDGGAARRGGEVRLPPGEPSQRRRCAVRTVFGRVEPCQAKVRLW